MSAAKGLHAVLSNLMLGTFVTIGVCCILQAVQAKKDCIRQLLDRLWGQRGRINTDAFHDLHTKHHPTQMLPGCFLIRTTRVCTSSAFVRLHCMAWHAHQRLFEETAYQSCCANPNQLSMFEGHAYILYNLASTENYKCVTWHACVPAEPAPWLHPASWLTAGWV